MVIMGAIEVQFLDRIPCRDDARLGAAYTLWMYKRVIFGEVANKQVAELSDANARELLVFGLLAIAVLCWACIPLRSPRSCTRRSTICSSTSR